MPETSAGLQFRPAQRSDIAHVAAIEARVHAGPWSPAQLADCLAPGNGFWVVESGGEIAAYAVVQEVLDEASLLNIAVDAPWQGQGLGRALLTFLLARAREHGMRQMFLEVRESNARAIALYESCGFKLVGRRKAYYGHLGGREDARVYSLELA